MTILIEELYEKEKTVLNLFEDADPLPVEMFIGQHIAVLGKSGAGKSVSNAVLMEEFTMTGIIQCIIDTEGDYYSLREWKPHKYEVMKQFKVKRRQTIPAKMDAKGNVKSKAEVKTWTEWNYRKFDAVCDTIMGKTKLGEEVERKSVIVLINKYDKKDRLEIIFHIIRRLWEERIRPNDKREAIALLIDEAHEKIPQNASSHKGLTTMLEDIAKQGRKMGLSLILSSQRPAEVQKNALAQCHMLIALKVDEHLDIEAYTLRLPMKPTAKETRELIFGQCKYFPPGKCYFRFPSKNPEDPGIKVLQMRWRLSRHTANTPGKESLINW